MKIEIVNCDSDVLINRAKNINNIFMKIKYKKWMGQKTPPIQVLSIVQSYLMFILSMGYKRSRTKPYITKQSN